MKITKKPIIIISVMAALLVAGGMIGAVSYNRYSKQLALDSQNNYLAAESTANGIVGDFNSAADNVMFAVEKLCLEEAAAKAAEESAAALRAAESAKAAEEAAKAEASNEAKVLNETENKQTPNNGGGAVSYSGLAFYAAKYIGNNDMSCDELVWRALADMGYAHTTVTATRISDGVTRQVPYVDYESHCTEVSLDQIRMGDILVSSGHVEIYVGNGKSIHGGYGLPGTGYTNVVNAWTTKNLLKAYRLN